MDQHRNPTQQQDKRHQTPPRRSNQPPPAQWDGKDRRTGVERRHGVVDPGMQMDEGSSR
jgi:hypothetical protein